MFTLAHVCHMSPADIDGAGFIDFLILLDGAKSYLEAKAKAGGLAD